MNRCVGLGLLLAGWVGGVCAGQKPVVEEKVPIAPAASAQEKLFHDARYEVSFRVPKGWDVTRKDGEVSQFHMDARSAPAGANLRGVATITFNPYPNTTLSGAMFYFSVDPKTSDEGCMAQASAKQKNGQQEVRKTQDIDGMSFAHGHDEYGDICVESRDEIYTAYRKGACYRFDLTLTTFCSVSSGVRDMGRNQMLDVEQKLADILSTVQLGWEKGKPHPVPIPEMQEKGVERVPMKKPGAGGL
jgi:hypothetical protein